MACKDYNGEYWKALEAFDIQGTVMCPFWDLFGGNLFLAFFLVGLVNIPIYSKTGSVLGPFTVTVIIGSVFFSQAGSVLSGLGVALLLFVLGFAPVLAIKRWETGRV